MCMKVPTSFVLFLPPSLERGLEDKACALLHMVQSALRCLPSCGSRCPGLRLELLTLAVQSPGEWSNLLGVKRCSAVGTTRDPGVKPHHQRLEGMLGPLPESKKAQDHQSHIHHLRCRTGKGQTHHHHHLWKDRKSLDVRAMLRDNVVIVGRCDQVIFQCPLRSYSTLTIVSKKPLVFILGRQTNDQPRRTNE